MAAQESRAIRKCKPCCSKVPPPDGPGSPSKIPAPECEEVVFLTPQGKQVAHISDDLRALTKDYPTLLCVIKLTATKMKKIDGNRRGSRRLRGGRQKSCCPHDARGNTARNYYQHLLGIAQSANAYAEIGKKRRPVKMKTRKRPTPKRLPCNRG